jgi:hypothetical protein
MKRLYFDVVVHVDEDAKVEGLEEGWDVWWTEKGLELS